MQVRVRYLQPLGASFGGRGCVDGEDVICNSLICSREHVINLNFNGLKRKKCKPIYPSWLDIIRLNVYNINC